MAQFLLRKPSSHFYCTPSVSLVAFSIRLITTEWSQPELIQIPPPSRNGQLIPPPSSSSQLSYVADQWSRGRKHYEPTWYEHSRVTIREKRCNLREKSNLLKVRMDEERRRRQQYIVKYFCR